MKDFQIKALDGRGWTGQYSRIEVTYNPVFLGHKDIKVYSINDDDKEEFLSLELVGYNLDYINYNHVDEIEFKNEVKNDSHRFIDFWVIVGWFLTSIIVGWFLTWVNKK